MCVSLDGIVVAAFFVLKHDCIVELILVFVWKNNKEVVENNERKLIVYIVVSFHAYKAPFHNKASQFNNWSERDEQVFYNNEEGGYILWTLYAYCVVGCFFQ